MTAGYCNKYVINITRVRLMLIRAAYLPEYAGEEAEISHLTSWRSELVLHVPALFYLHGHT